MTACERIRAEAAGIAALGPADPEAAAARAHARDCPGCRAALLEADRLQELLGHLSADDAGEARGPLAAAAEALAGELRAEGRWRGVASAAAAAAAFALVVALARQRSRSAADWGLAAALAALAAALGALAGRLARRVAAAAVGLALIAAALAGGGGLADGGTGLECAATEVLAAGAVVAAVFIALRRSATSPAPWALAAGAAAGALAGDAALQIVCPSRSSLAHLLAFHVGGVLLAAALARLALRPWARGG